jgi:penicillin amidase
MSGSLTRACAAVACAAVAFATLVSCGGAAPPPEPPPQAPQTSGTLVLDGLKAEVTIARDTWGIPHITAANDDDLYFAQGLVQAQDRLFQMDLWRRSVQGRLSEVLGANFIDRDAMTRRVQFRGDLDAEWASYGPDTRRIAVAFTSGINAWVRRARQQLPEEFVVAGWAPELWRPEDLLNRTDAFLASANAADDLFRARLAAAIGVSRLDRLLPDGTGRGTAIDPAVDLSAITYVVPDTLRRIGTPPFFLTLATPASTAPRPGQDVSQPSRAPAQPSALQQQPTAQADDSAAQARSDDATTGDDPVVPAPRSHAWVVGGARTNTGAPLLAVQEVDRLRIPSARYLVHLTAPGIDVAGATSPWLPGVGAGHNDRIAWSAVHAPMDTQDVYVERLNPANHRQVERDGRWADLGIDHERVDVKGRARPFEYDRQYSSNGVVIALDRARHLVYTLRWSGAEPGGAAGLAALGLNRARSQAEFEQALTRWHMPVAAYVYADRDGRTSTRVAGRVPARSNETRTLVGAGWDRSRWWTGWLDVASMQRLERPGTVVSDGATSSDERIAEALARPGRRTVEEMLALQTDVRAMRATRLLPLLGDLRVPADLEPVRARLLAWDGHVRADSSDARMYVRWEAAIARELARRAVPAEFVNDLARRIDPVELVVHPGAAWSGADSAAARDALLVGTLRVVAANRSALGSSAYTVSFTHPLGVFDAARRRFDVGPFGLPGYHDTVFATGRSAGPTFRAVFDVGDWDRSRVVVAPGQSGSASSTHYEDLAADWAAPSGVPLAFTTDAVRAVTKEVMVLRPAQHPIR